MVAISRTSAASNGSVKLRSVRRMTTLSVIRHDDDRVRAIVDESLGGSAEDWLRTEAI